MFLVSTMDIHCTYSRAMITSHTATARSKQAPLRFRVCFSRKHRCFVYAHADSDRQTGNVLKFGPTRRLRGGGAHSATVCRGMPAVVGRCVRVLRLGTSTRYQGFYGRFQGRRVDHEFTRISNHLPPKRVLSSSHGIIDMSTDRAFCKAYQYDETTQGHIAATLSRCLGIPIHVDQAVHVHPLAWQAVLWLTERGFKPVAGQVAVAVPSAGLATAIDGLWWHHRRRQWGLVELKKVEGVSVEQTHRHVAQLALTTAMFGYTRQHGILPVAVDRINRKNTHACVSAMVLQVGSAGPHAIMLTTAQLTWAAQLLGVTTCGTAPR